MKLHGVFGDAGISGRWPCCPAFREHGGLPPARQGRRVPCGSSGRARSGQPSTSQRNACRSPGERTVSPAAAADRGHALSAAGTSLGSAARTPDEERFDRPRSRRIATPAGPRRLRLAVRAAKHPPAENPSPPKPASGWCRASAARCRLSRSSAAPTNFSAGLRAHHSDSSPARGDRRRRGDRDANHAASGWRAPGHGQ